MKTPLHDASARQHSGEPLGANRGRKDRLRGLALAEVDGEIAELVGQSTQELRRAWRRLHHISPPLGLSRDLIIRGLADQLQQRAHGGPTPALQRRLQVWAAEFEKGVCSFDPGGALKTGATLGMGVPAPLPHHRSGPDRSTGHAGLFSHGLLEFVARSAPVFNLTTGTSYRSHRPLNW